MGPMKQDRHNRQRRTAPSAALTGALLALIMVSCTLQVSVLPPGAESPGPAQTDLSDAVATAVQGTLEAALLESSAAAQPSATPPTLLPNGEQLIIGFEANPVEIEPGQTVTLSWSHRGDLGRICAFNPAGEAEDCFDVPTTGARAVVTSPRARNEITYVLTAYRGALVEEASVSIMLRCPDTWFFLNAPARCPISAPITTYALSQRFERGLMIGLLDGIYILFDTPGVEGGQFVQVPDPWAPGLPTIDTEIPSGYYEPVFGFGILWRGELDPVIYGSLTGTIRSRIGWAVEPVYGYTTLFQCDSTAIEEFRVCYLLGPDETIYALSLGFWEPWTGVEE